MLEPQPNNIQAIEQEILRLAELGNKEEFSEQALGYYQQAIKVADGKFEHLAPEFQTEVLSIYHNTGLMAGRLGGDEQALPYWIQGIQIAEDKLEQLAPYAQELVLVLNHYSGLATYHLGDEIKALQHFQKGIQLAGGKFEKITSDTQAVVLDLCRNTGLLVAKLGDTAQALKCFTEGIQLAEGKFEKLLPDGQASVLTLHVNAGFIANKLGNATQALKCSTEGIQLVENKFEQLTPDGQNSVLTLHRNAGFIASKIGNATQALKYYAEGIQLAEGKFEKLLPDGQTSVLALHRDAGSIANELGNATQALKYYAEGIQLAIQYCQQLTSEAIDYLQFSALSIGLLSQLSLSPHFGITASINGYCPKDAFLEYDRFIELSNYTYWQQVLIAAYKLYTWGVLQWSWAYPRYAPQLGSLADSLFAYGWYNPSHIIRHLQQHRVLGAERKPLSLSSLHQQAARYLCHAKHWQRPPVANVGEVSLAYIALRAPSVLATLQKAYHQSISLTQYPAQPLTERLQNPNLFDWPHIAKQLDIASLEPTAYQALYTLFGGVHSFGVIILDFDHDCAKNTAKQDWLQTWANLHDAGHLNKLIQSIATAVQSVAWHHIEEINKLLQQLGNQTPELALQVWLLNQVPQTLATQFAQFSEAQTTDWQANHAWQYINHNSHWSNLWLQQLPMPSSNNSLLQALHSSLSLQLPKLTQTSLIEQAQHPHLHDTANQQHNRLQPLWHCLELGRIGLNFNQLPDSKHLQDLAKNDDDAHKAVRRALMAQLTAIEARRGLEPHEVEPVDPFMTFGELDKQLKKMGASLSTISIAVAQQYIQPQHELIQLYFSQGCLYAIRLNADYIQLQQLPEPFDQQHWQPYLDAWCQLQYSDTTNIAIGTSENTINHLWSKLCDATQSPILQLRQHLCDNPLPNNLDHTVAKPLKHIVLIADANLSALPWQVSTISGQTLDAKAQTTTHISLTTSVANWCEQQKTIQTQKNGAQPQANHHDVIPTTKQAAQTSKWNVIATNSVLSDAHVQTATQAQIDCLQQQCQSNTIEVSTAAQLLHQMGQSTHTHIIAHGAYKAYQPEHSFLDIAEDAKLPAWQLACAELQGEITLSVCHAMAMSQPNNQDTHHRANSQYLGAMGIGAAMYAAGASCVVGSAWQMNALASFAFYHFYTRNRLMYSVSAAVLHSQQQLQQLTAEALHSMIEQLSDEQIKHNLFGQTKSLIAQAKQNNTTPFDDAVYWAGYVVIGDAPALKPAAATLWQWFKRWWQGVWN